ncbi:MAG: LuxR C-terminal-related transcriptional regulator [Phycisphaerales bacterium JB037]
MERIRALEDGLRRVGSLGELASAIGPLLEPLGFWAVTLGAAPLERGALVCERAVLWSTLPEEFQRAYRSEGMESFDPVFDLLAGRYRGFAKSSIGAHFAGSAAHGRITELADRHALGEAWMVPLNTADRSRGVVLFTRESPRRFAERLACGGAEWHASAVALMTRAEELGFGPLPSAHPERAGLTPREIECLSWCARGSTNDEIAAALGIRERTVRYHLGNAFRKLGSDRRGLAITRAVRLGLVRT